MGIERELLSLKEKIEKADKMLAIYEDRVKTQRGILKLAIGEGVGDGIEGTGRAIEIKNNFIAEYKKLSAEMKEMLADFERKFKDGSD